MTKVVRPFALHFTDDELQTLATYWSRFQAKVFAAVSRPIGGALSGRHLVAAQSKVKLALANSD